MILKKRNPVFLAFLNILALQLNFLTSSHITPYVAEAKIDTSREVIRITQYPHILMNAEKLSLAIHAIDFQSKSEFFVEEDVYLQP
ncbi:hypothetical protein V6N11_061698 [Hibiscus sabdariffa]|uniref:Uncharacterized protein n=1 Tax=Hibiscus sabdariffa TaxID=183260 RepID=A0ABR2NUY9_9ROSI